MTMDNFAHTQGCDFAKARRKQTEWVQLGAVTGSESFVGLSAVDFGGLGFTEDSQYGFWPVLFGSLFLYISYYGTDQTQVQRELSSVVQQLEARKVRRAVLATEDQPVSPVVVSPRVDPYFPTKIRMSGCAKSIGLSLPTPLSIRLLTCMCSTRTRLACRV
mgnify:CR=1 FL=1